MPQKESASASETSRLITPLARRASGPSADGPVHSVPGGLVFTLLAIGDTLNCDAVAQDRQPVFTVIFFSAFCASAVFGNVTISTPLLKLASTLSRSTPSGT
jgi:hypothetical protein